MCVPVPHISSTVLPVGGTVQRLRSLPLSLPIPNANGRPVNLRFGMNRNQKNKKMGDLFEKGINEACEWYRQMGIADIQKTPEPMKVIRPMGNGKFEAVFTKQAQPDYKGVIFSDGRAIIFDAKYTEEDKIKLSAFSAQQIETLGLWKEHGCMAYSLISIRFQHFYFVPWGELENMEAYEIPITNRHIDFLKGAR